MHFTKDSIRAIRTQGKDRIYVHDTRTPNFAVCVTSTGVRTFYRIGRIGGLTERARLGTLSELTVSQARRLVERMNRIVDAKKGFAGRCTSDPFFWKIGWYVVLNERPLKVLDATPAERLEVAAAKRERRKHTLTPPAAAIAAAADLFRGMSIPEPDSESLAALVTAYQRRKLAGKHPQTAAKYRIAVESLKRHLGRPPMLSDLTEETVSEWVASEASSGRLSTDTVSMYHAKMLSLWRFACRQDLVKVEPEQEKLKSPKRVAIAWSREQLATLFQACERQTGEIGGVSAGLWWTSLHFALWDTGERISAILSGEWSRLDLQTGDFSIAAEHRKGKTEDKSWRLGPNTLAVLRQMVDPQRDLIWPWPSGKGTLLLRYKSILKAAGLPHDRKHMFHCMRKSVASFFEAAGGDATKLLGHSSRTVTEAYLSPSIVKVQQACELLFCPNVETFHPAAVTRPNVETFHPAAVTLPDDFELV